MTLQLRNISAGYGRDIVLRDIDLTVRPGEIVALVGANGAGKSTLVRTISGLVEARQGTISFAGERIDRLPSGMRVLKGIAQVPEGRQVFPEMSVEENLLMGGFVHRGGLEKERRAEIMALCRLFPVLESRLTHPAGNLSGGQQQMLAIARGLMARPKLLILDEPSLGLSPLLVTEIFTLIGQLREQGLSILLSEQNARQSLAIADRGYAVANGRVVAEGSGTALSQSDEIAARYLGGTAVKPAEGTQNVLQLRTRLAAVFNFPMTAFNEPAAVRPPQTGEPML